VYRVFENSGKLVAPTVVPKEIAMLKEEPCRMQAEPTECPVAFRAE
jgi:hypothetical protein